MDFPDIVRAGFRDELEKISGMVRAGRPPMLPGTAAAKASVGRATKGLGHLFKGAAASFGPKSLAAALAAGAVAGGVATHHGKKAVSDYKMGRAYRKAQEHQEA